MIGIQEQIGRLLPRILIISQAFLLSLTLGCREEIGPARPVPPPFDDPDKIIAQFAELKAHGKLSPSDYLQCGKAYLQKGERMRRSNLSWGWNLERPNIEEAAEMFVQGIKLDSTSSTLLHHLGISLHRLGNFSAAIPVLEKASRFDSLNSEILSDLGWSYFWRSDNPYVTSYNPDWYPRVAFWVERAQTALEKAVRLDPTNATGHRRLGNVYYVQRRFERAFEEYQVAVKLGFSDPDDYLDLHYRFENSGSETLKEKTRWMPPVVAISMAPLILFVDEKKSVLGNRLVLLERAISLDSNYVRPIVQMVRLLNDYDFDTEKAVEYYMKLREIDPAPIYGLKESFYKKAIQLHPDNYIPYLDWGSIYMWEKRQKADVRTFDPESAAVLFRKAIELNPSIAAPYLHLWVMALEKGDFAAASQFFQAALQAQDKRVWTADIVFRLTELKRFDDALTLLENFEGDPFQRSIEYRSIASFCSDEGDLKNAERSLLKSLSLVRNPLTKQSLAEVYTKKRDFDKAIALLQETLQEPNPNRWGWKDSYIYTQIGKNYGHKGDMKRAEENFKKAEQLGDGKSDVLYTIGYAYKEIGHILRAREYFQKAAALGNSSAQQELIEMEEQDRSNKGKNKETRRGLN